MSSALFGATRRRLVLWNIAVTGVIIVAFALVAYVLAAHVLSGEVDGELASRAAEVQTHLSRDLSDLNNDHDYDTDAPGVFVVVLMVNVEVPDCVKICWLKLALAPDGRLPTPRVMIPRKLLLVVTVTV